MCQLIVTTLACGHKIRGPLLQCPAASPTTPRGPPHVDGRSVLCARSEALNLHQSTCCEVCFATIFRGFLGAVCHPCRRVVIPRMGQELVDMLQRASDQDTGSHTPESNTGHVNQTRKMAEDGHRKAEEACKQAEQALNMAETSCRRATAECRKVTADCKRATKICNKINDPQAGRNHDTSISSAGCHWPDN